MVEGGKVTLRFEIDNEQFKRVMQEINKDLDKFKQKATEAGTGAEKLGTNVKKAGEQSASAAVNFQTMTQGAINLTTAFAQSYASISNIQRAHTSLAQATVSLDRAEDQLHRKQFKLNQEMAKAVPNMERVALLQNEIATAMDDYAVKQQKVKDTQDQLNDTQMLFAVNLVNVGFSAIQTAISMKNLAMEMKAAGVASTVFNASMGKIALIATAVILAMEGVVAVAKAMNLEWADQIPSISNLGKQLNSTFTSSDEILKNSKKNVEEYGESWKDLSKTIKTEVKDQSEFVTEHMRMIKQSVLETQQTVSRKSINFNFAPEKGATKSIPWKFDLDNLFKWTKSFGVQSAYASSVGAEADRVIQMRKKSGLSGGDVYIPIHGFDYGSPIEYNKDFWSNTTLDKYGKESIVNKLNKQYSDYKKALIELQTLNVPEDIKDYMEITIELNMMDIEDELKKYDITPNKSGKPNLANLTPDTSFSGIPNTEASKGYAKQSIEEFNKAKDILKKIHDPTYRSQRDKLLKDYLRVKSGAYSLYRLAMGTTLADFDLGTNNGRALKIKEVASFLNKFGISGMDYAISRLGFEGMMRSDSRFIQGINNRRTRVNLGGQIGTALSMYSNMGGVNITGKQSEAMMKTLSMTLGAFKYAVTAKFGSPFNKRGPSRQLSSASMASVIAGMTAGTGAARNRAGGHSKFRRDRWSGKMAAFQTFTVRPAMSSAGFDGFDLGVSKRNYGANQRSGFDRAGYSSAYREAFQRALGLSREYDALSPVLGYDMPISDLDNFQVLGDAISKLSQWRNLVQNTLTLSFANQAQIESDSRRGRDELEDRLRFEERRSKISTGVTSL